MSQIATDQTQTQTPVASLKDRHVSTTISREAHNALHDAVRRLAAAGDEATISGLLSELVARHLPALVRARIEARAATIEEETRKRIAAMRAAAGIRLPCHHTNAWECKDVKCTKHRPMIKKDAVDDF